MTNTDKDNAGMPETLDSTDSSIDLAAKARECNEAINRRAEDLARRETELARLEAEAAAASLALDIETARMKALESSLSALTGELNERSVKIAETEQQIYLSTMSLEAKHAAADAREKELETEFALKRQKAKYEITEETEKSREAFNAEIAKFREKRFAELSLEIEAERKSRLDTLSAEIRAERAVYENERIALIKQKEELGIQQEVLRKQGEELRDKLSEIDFQKKQLAVRTTKISEREENLDTDINLRMTDTVKTLEEYIAAKDEELASLRKQLGQVLRDNGAFESFKVAYGGEPEMLRIKLDEYEETVKTLKNELVNRPSMEIKDKADRLDAEVKTLSARNESLARELKSMLEEQVESENTELRNRRLYSDNIDLLSQVNELEAKNRTYIQRLERLSSTEARAADRDERIAELRAGHLVFDTEDKKYSELGKEQPTDEIAWLTKIYDKCIEYDIKFYQRILYAFHTALKVSDWSTIAVLAGVSGTGKSELPRLYAAFGGINFINVAVQPNWDSQESMLGFFNSIDNKFDAQPLLRFLVQCNEELRDYMGIVLLDEMNLAHVEHYFADFLSKLEERRGKTSKNIPYIDVKLGAGVKPFPLEMQRNILWTGTMNQDETTKSLSDKVLDRGVVITFPRPTKLKSRENMGRIDTFSEKTLLRYQTWAGTSKEEGWVKRRLWFSDEQKKETARFKGIIEEINKYLSVAGRAVGHRVWQSIEYYIANYPTVINCSKDCGEGLSTDMKQAMHTAFEDQIVQKVMPKLHGIDTRPGGVSREQCLNKINSLLNDEKFNLARDFHDACEFGYGQFMWKTAHYITETDVD
jgi:hypothetical protein